MGLYDFLQESINQYSGGGSSSSPEPAASGNGGTGNAGGKSTNVYDFLQQSIGGGGGTQEPQDAVGRAGQTVVESDTRGRGNRSYLREAMQDRQNAQNQTVTWDNFQSKLQQALNQYNGYYDTFQRTFGERQDLTDDDRRRMNLAGTSTLNNGEFGNGLEDWKTYGEGQERQIKAQTADLRKFLDDNADKLNQDAAKEVREQLDLMDNYSGQLWKAAYNDEGLRARDAYKRTGNAYTVAEKAYNEAQAKLKDVIQNTPSDVDYDKAVEAARQEAKAAEEALRLARNAYEEAGGLGHSYSNEDRVSDTIKGAMQNSAASSIDAFRALWEKGEGQRLANDQPRIAQLDLAARTAQTEYFRARAAAGGNEDDPAVKAAKQKYEEARDFANRYQGIVEGDQGLAEKAAAKADDILSRSQLDIARAKEGASGLTKGLVDVGVAGTQLATDAAISAMTGIPSMAILGIRSFGGGTQQARLGGGNIDQQLAYGAANAAVEMMTEKMADGLAGAFGKGYADDVAEEVIGKLAQSDAGRTALRTIYGMMGEGAEEFVSSAIDPALRSLYNGKSAKENYSEEEISDWLYDALIGAALALPGAGISMVNGQNAQKNAALRTADNVRMSGLGSVANQTDAAWNVLSGRYSPEQQANIERYARNQLGIQDPATQYTSAQQATPEQQAARQTVRTMLENGRVNNTAANQILNDPELRAAAEYQTGLSFEGMTTEEARAALQRAARSGAYTTAQFNAQTERAATADNARAQAALEEEAARNNASNYDSYIRGILRTGADTQTANEILNDPTLKEVWERMTGKTLPENRKSALKMLRETTRSNVDINVDSAIEQYIAERNAPSQTAENAAQTQDVSADEITQPETQTDATGEAQELNSNPTTEAETQTAETAQNSSEEAQTPPQEVTEQMPPVNENATAKEVPGQSNSIKGQAAAYGLDYEAPNHISKPEVESLTNALNRASSDMNGEMQKLMGKDAWTGEDIDTAMVINGKLLVDAIKNNDFTAVDVWNKVLEPHKSEAGRSLQALSKWARGGRAVIADARTALADSNLSDAQQAKVLNTVMEFADRYDTIENGDLDSIRKLILDMNSERGTGTFIPGEFEKLLNKETDFDYLKEYAMRQLMAIPNESINKPDLGQRLKTWQSLAQLFRITTTLRNVLGNETFSIIDFVPQNTVGTWVDALLSAVDGTGLRTVGMSSSWLDSNARKAEAKAIDRSMMEIAGDVFMGGENAYNTQGPRTFKMSDSNVLNRVLSRAEQLSGYALQTTDEAASARQIAAYENMLKRLNGENMTDAQRAELAQNIADYRLFKNKGVARNLSQGAHDVMNRLGVGGQITENGKMRRGGFGMAELLGFSYPGVPANLGVKPLEYSPLNAAKGIVEMVKYFNGMKADGSPNLALRQQAAMDFARGVTGTAMIAALSALFRSGVFKNFDDEDDEDVRAQNRAEGKTGTLINLSAAERLFRGESSRWRDGDRYMNIAYLEPLNGLMAISDYISKDMKDNGVTAQSLAGDFMKGEWNGLLDMPVMQSIASLADVMNTKYDEETGGSKIFDAAASIAGNAATGMIPGLLSQGAKAMDTVERDTSADTVFGQTVNAAKNAIPGLRQTLPEKYDSLGNPVATPGDTTYDRVMNALFRPGTVANLHQSEASRIISDLIEQTGDKSIMPATRAPYSITVNGEKVELSANDRQKYKRENGAMVSDMVNDLTKDRSFQNSTPEEQKEVIKKIESYAMDRAKAEAAKDKGLDYTSDFQTLLDGIEKPGSPYDVRKLEEKNVGEYLSFSTRLTEAQNNGDYAAIDRLLSDYGKLDENTKNVLDDKGAKDLKNLLAFKDAGSSADSFYKIKDAIGEEQWNLDASSSQGGHVRLAGLGSADIPDAEKDKLVESGAFGMSKTATSTYQILRQYGLSPKDASAWFENADWFAKNAETEPKADGTLNAYEVAVGISKIPGLSNDQRNEMYNAFKAAIQKPGDPYDTWKKRSYTVALGVSTNYGRTTGKPDPMNIAGSGGTTSGAPAQSGGTGVNSLLDYIGLAK